MTPADFLKQTADAKAHEYAQAFQDYGMLINSMTPDELAVEIGNIFSANPKGSAIICCMMARIMALEIRMKAIDGGTADDA